MDDHASRLMGDMKGSAMAGRVLSFPRTSPLSTELEIGPFCENSRSYVGKPLLSMSERVMDSRTAAEGLGCIRGTALALLFEAATGLVIYGIWQVIHLR